MANASFHTAAHRDAAKLVNFLTLCEFEPRYEADTRRVMRRERETLYVTMQSGSAEAIAAAVREARRVVNMWVIERAP